MTSLERDALRDKLETFSNDSNYFFTLFMQTDQDLPIHGKVPRSLTKCLNRNTSFTQKLLRKKKRCIAYLESLKIVDEDVGQPEVVDELEVDRDHRLRGDDGVVQLRQEPLGDPESRLLP